MKIRINGASVRIRLSKSEVAWLVYKGLVQEEAIFPTGILTYAVRKMPLGTRLIAIFENNKITLFVPQALIQDWDINNVVSIDTHMPVGESGSLYLLLEKDFQCLDQSNEDQSDNYINPNQNC